MEYKYRTAPAALDTEHEGRLKAAFSVFDEIDSDGDIVRASAFTDGQVVPMVWAHDWAKPIGKGVVRVEGKHAVFDGEFNLKTAAGRDAYESVKFASDIQEYSWGFQILQSGKTRHGGKDAREITKATVFEVSPVLVGANRNTRTLAIKGQERMDEQEGRVLADLDEYMARVKSLADLRAKEGRSLSTARRSRLEAMLSSLSEHMTDLQAMLEETTPRDPEKAAPAAVFAEFLANEARALGVEV